MVKERFTRGGCIIIPHICPLVVHGLQMLIFWESRLVFLATPKAGSTAVEAALEGLANVAVQRPAALKHADLRTYRQHIEPWLHSVTGDRFTTVALMREPVGWLRSWYRFRLRDDDEDPEHPMTGISFAQFADAYARNVLLVSPSTLLATLRTIANLWRQAQQSHNAQEIARQAGALYDKFVGFIGDLDDIGRHLTQTRQAFDGACNKLSSGRGNLVRQTERLRELGVKPGKSIPAGWKEKAGADDADTPVLPEGHA